MNEYEQNEKSSRALISAIINHAIIESTNHKRPRPPEFRISRFVRKKLSINIEVLYRLLIEESKKINKGIPTKYSLNILSEIIYILNIMIPIPRRKIETENEKLAWRARKFIKAKNKWFSFYSELLDIDPIYLEEKIWNHINLRDNSAINFSMNLAA